MVVYHFRRIGHPAWFGAEQVADRTQARGYCTRTGWWLLESHRTASHGRISVCEFCRLSFAVLDAGIPLREIQSEFGGIWFDRDDFRSTGQHGRVAIGR